MENKSNAGRAAANSILPRATVADVIQSATSYFAAGDTKKANEIIKAALTRRPASVPLHLANARFLAAQGHTAEGLAALQRVFEKFPNSSRAAVALARGYLRTGQLEEARGVLSQMDARNADKQAIMRIELAIAQTAEDWPTVASRAGELVSLLESPRAPLLQTLALALWQTKDFAGAEAAAQRALTLKANLAWAELVLGWCRFRHGDLIGAETAAKSVLRRNPKLTSAALLLARARLRQADTEGAIDAVSRLLAAEPEPVEHEREVAAARLAAATRQTFSPTRNRDRGRVLAALIASKAARTVGDKDRAAFFYQKAIEKIKPQRPIVADNPRQELLIAERPGAKTGVFVFTGLGGRMGLRLPIFDHYLAALGVSAFYLKDFTGLAALNGIKSLGGRYAATLNSLHDLITARGIKRVCTIGYLAGVRAAVRYGIDLNAESIIGFSGATGLEPALAEANLNSRIIERFTESLSPDILDLNRFLRYRVYRSNIELIYDPEAESERDNALHLSGLTGVHLHPLTGRAHYESITAQLAVEDKLFDLLATLLGVKGA
jgi:lipopolysaccharide biosynthesis regulator YciM